MSHAVRRTVLRQAAVPTVRALAWAPVLAVGAVLLLAAGLFRLADQVAPPLLWLGAGATAATLVFGLRDPAASLLAATPTSLAVRRALRLGLVAAVALPLWLLVTATAPGDGTALGPVVALTATGVAVATWLPDDRGVSVAAAVPLLWAASAELFAGSLGVFGDAAAWWRTDPAYVVTAAVVAIVLGRNR